MRVQIVFTKQPFDKKDWKTNYYELLSNRITEILLIDSTLNSNGIEWEIILQTQAKTTSEAKNLPHGIKIIYKTIPTPTAEEIKPTQVEDKTSPDIVFIAIDSVNRQDSIVKTLTDEELKAILYPKSVTDKNTEWQKPQKIKKVNEPGCPTFKTRMEKPRRSIFSRIFRR